MALLLNQVMNKAALQSSFAIACRGICTTSNLNKNVRTGIPQTTRFRTKKLTYEEANAPHYINVRKGWLSWNTGNLHGEKRKAETIFEDVILRKFMAGTWHNGLATDVVIKRRHNTVILGFLVLRQTFLPHQIYFLKGYTEELLSHWLRRKVKCEIQTVQSSNDMIFKKI